MSNKKSAIWLREKFKRLNWKERKEKMTKSEYIIWKCETIEQIESEHPEWNTNQVNNFFSALEALLEQREKKKSCYNCKEPD